ncbi:hypothetical protein A9Q84_01595 [Halobacteriovorax marinus]|uniref:YihY/virulence factor BrkB family protein n=1 Tax=Halobacteriovorax marinus TaxID=97084 RepID=A0A1Y5FHR2_9BACT|nr:hypothetical protein A9Q84_01595 [Halobacteriovorax marinus]
MNHNAQMENEQNKIIEIGKNYESYSYKFTTVLVSKLLHGFFLFKKRKGEILAGATTFFAVLSFCPSILLFISLLGYITGDINQSKAIVLETINANIPQLAPWILKSISAIVEQQLSSSKTVNVFNLIFLGYSLVGLVSALMYGIRSISKTEAKGGFLIEDMKSFAIGSMMSVFLGTLIIISNKILFKLIFFPKAAALPDVTKFLFDYQIAPIALSLGFFTLFYKFSSGKNISYKNSFVGACAFVACFIVGKSGYWIYLQSSKQDLTQNYGNFYTIVMAVVWVYYLVCSFFYGASISNLKKEDLFPVRQQAPTPIKKAVRKSAVPPGLPKVPSQSKEPFKKAA